MVKKWASFFDIYKLAWLLGAVLLAIFYCYAQKFDARVRPGQPSPEFMKQVLSEISVPRSHRMTRGLQVESRDGRVVYTENFSSMESVGSVAKYYKQLMENRGWSLAYANSRLASYDMKFCKGRISFFVEISGLGQSSIYSLSAAWSYRNSFAYCDT
jgi:hypothetical protein